MASCLAAVVVLGTSACSGSGDDPEETTTTSTTVGTTTTTVEAALEDGRQLSVFVPSVGDCFDRRTIEVEGEDDEQVVLLLDCELPHQYEVFHTFEVTDEDVAAADASPTTTPTGDAGEDLDGEGPDVEGTDDPETSGSDTTTTTASDGTGEGTSSTTTPTVTRSIEAILEDIARRRCPQHLGEFVGTPYERSVLEVSWWLPTQDEWDSGTRLVGCTLFDPATERMAGSQRDSRR